MRAHSLCLQHLRNFVKVIAVADRNILVGTNFQRLLLHMHDMTLACHSACMGPTGIGNNIPMCGDMTTSGSEFSGHNISTHSDLPCTQHGTFDYDNHAQRLQSWCSCSHTHTHRFIAHCISAAHSTGPFEIAKKTAIQSNSSPPPWHHAPGWHAQH